MITKGFVEEVLDNNSVKVRCPVFDGILSAEENNLNYSSAPISSMSGVKCSINVGDVVFVGFENDDRFNPIVLGCLYLGEGNRVSSETSMELESIDVLSSAKLSKNTSIGDVLEEDLANLTGLNNNIQEFFNDSDDSLEKFDKDIDDLNEDLNTLFDDISELSEKTDALIEKLNNIKETIGVYGDTRENTLFGRIYSYIKTIDKLNDSLGKVEEGLVISDMLSELYEKITEASNVLTSSHLPSTGTSSGSSMISRAEKMINATWTPKNTLKQWNSSSTFDAGKTYYGMPYTLFGYGYSYDTWMEHAESNVTASGDVAGYGYREGPKYGSCCADFVSEVLGLPSIIRSCAGLASSGDLTVLSGNEAKVSNIQVADVLIASNNSHVIWVGGIADDTLTMYEQSPPLAHRFTLSKSSNNSNGFIYYNGTLYDRILRPNSELVDQASNDDSANLTGDWICKGTKTYGDYSGQALTENEYMNNALCFWKICKSSGWTAQAAAGAFSNTYGESTGNPWSHGTGGGGLFGFTPFDSGTAYGTGIYDYAQNVLGDAELRWNGDVQVGYINWQASNIASNGWTGIFAVRGSGYWNYSPAGVPDNLSLGGYMGLTISATECAKLWLARYGVVSIGYHGSNVDNVVNSHIAKAEELYGMYTRY